LQGVPACAQPNSTLAPIPVNATIGNANPLGRVFAVQPFAPAPGCVPTVYDLLKNNPNASTFLRLTNATGRLLFLLRPEQNPEQTADTVPDTVLHASLYWHSPSSLTWRELHARLSAGLTPSLQDPNATYTVLVPTNAAFANLSQNVLNTSDINTLRLVTLLTIP
jgi:uncharacterized surface protein with fasciclin (FAS1) repeats